MHPADNITAIDIYDCIEIHEAVGHRDIGYISTSDLVAVHDIYVELIFTLRLVIARRS